MLCRYFSHITRTYVSWTFISILLHFCYCRFHEIIACSSWRSIRRMNLQLPLITNSSYKWKIRRYALLFIIDYNQKIGCLVYDASDVSGPSERYDKNLDRIVLETIVHLCISFSFLLILINVMCMTWSSYLDHQVNFIRNCNYNNPWASTI